MGDLGGSTVTAEDVMLSTIAFAMRSEGAALTSCLSCRVALVLRCCRMESPLGRNRCQLGSPLMVSLILGSQRLSSSSLSMVVRFMLHRKFSMNLLMAMASWVETTGRHATEGVWPL